MFKIQEVRELIKLIDNSNIDEFEYATEGATIKMKKQANTVVAYETVPAVQQRVTPAAVENKAEAEPAPAPAVAVKEEVKKVQDEALQQIKSPMVGTFYASPSPDAAPYVSVGDRVNEDTVVCIVEAMKLFNEIEAEVSGEIVEVLVKDGQLVEYGQPLFLVR
jgi:acetyl-CoA carboxylase biotin carboxyl carrier protein